MVAIAAAVVASKVKLGRVSPMLWLSAVLIVGFGALTIWFHDPKFIQLKPTIIYTGLGLLLIGGAFAGRPLLKYVLEAGFEGLSERGWLVISRNWGLFFIGMAVLNELLVRSFSFDTWLSLKVWVLVPLVLGALAVAWWVHGRAGGESPVQGSASEGRSAWPTVPMAADETDKLMFSKEPVGEARPADFSQSTWDTLNSALANAPNKDQERTRVVSYLRFQRAVSKWGEMTSDERGLIAAWLAAGAPTQ